jgi:hypothetical protein
MTIDVENSYMNYVIYFKSSLSIAYGNCAYYQETKGAINHITWSRETLLKTVRLTLYRSSLFHTAYAEHFTLLNVRQSKGTNNSLA